MFARRSWQLIMITIGLALALSGGVEIAQSTAPGQSVPTRTPTPDATSPDPTATTGGGGATSATSVPQNTPTSTTLPAATATTAPATGRDALPTAEACSEEPTIQALNSPINVRSGPGTDYDVVGALSYLEVRVIAGRAAQAAWWQIRMPDGSLAWVTDELVAVSGYTGLVPLVDAAKLAQGNTPTPGPTWAPTPNPACPSPTPTMTATATATATAAATATATATATAESDGAAATAPEATATEEAPPTPMPTVEPETDATPTVSAPPADTGENDGGGNLWLPVTGLLLIGAAIVLFIRGRQVA